MAGKAGKAEGDGQRKVGGHDFVEQWTPWDLLAGWPSFIRLQERILRPLGFAVTEIYPFAY